MIKHLCLLALLQCTSSLRAEEIISWYYSAPYLEVHDGKISGGLMADNMQLLVDSLPQYHHQFIEASIARTESDLIYSPHACSMPLLKSVERESEMYFSTVAAAGVSNRLVMRAETIAKLKLSDSLPLADVLANQQLQGVVVDQRSYGKLIDHALELAHASKALRRISQGSDTALNLVLHQRADYTIESPVALRRWEQRNPENAGKLVSVYIDGDPRYFAGYYACNRNEWGLDVLKQINLVLAKITRSVDYNRTFISYLPDAEKDGYRQYWKELLQAEK